MSLFDSIKRTETRVKYENESYFDFLNISAEPEAESVRKMLDEWFLKIPLEEREDIYQRFRSRDNRNHFGAFWELYLHELLLKMGFSIPRYHPETESHQSTTPDFLVVGKGVEFYLEGTVAWLSNEEEASNKRASRVYDLLNKLSSPDYFLQIDVKGEPKTDPSVRQLRKKLEKWLQILSYEEIKNSYKGEAIPPYKWKHEDWVVIFTPIPKSGEMMGKPGIHPIGVTSTGIKIVTPQESIRRSIREKAKKYGEMKKPLIVAVNALENFVDESAIMDALFGDQKVALFRKADGSCEDKMDREGNGAWFNQYGPRNKRISGVLMGIRIYPWNITDKTPILYHHPWATVPLNEQIWQLPQKIVNEHGKMEEKSGSNISAFLKSPFE